MLREITWEEFLTWREYERVEPFEDERADYNAAHIVQALWNIARDTTKNPNGWTLSHFLLPFGDAPGTVVAKQTVQYQEQVIDAWIGGSNAIFAAKEGK